MREMPNVSAAYDKLKDRGFAVLGISLDRENAVEKIRDVAGSNNMPWQQVYDGKYFQAAVAQQYQIKSIPAAYLIDGDTGMIIANGNDLRGEKLIPAIEKVLESGKPVSRENIGRSRS
jgi:peroxiredoxin